MGRHAGARQGFFNGAGAEGCDSLMFVNADNNWRNKMKSRWTPSSKKMDERVIEAYINGVRALILTPGIKDDELGFGVRSKMYRLAQAAYSQGRGSGYESGFDAGMSVGLEMARAEKK